MTQKKIKVLHIVPRFTTGGAERLVLQYAELLDKDSYNIAVANTVEDGELRPAFEKLPITLFVGSRGHDGGRWGIAKKLETFIKTFQPDIIHTHLFGADLFGWYFTRVKKYKAVWISTQHNVEYRTSCIRRFVWKRILKKAYRIIAVADKVKAYDVSEFKLPESTIRVIKNGIELDKWIHIKRNKKTDDTLHLAIVGRLEEQKGHTYVLQALSMLDTTTWHLHVYGDGSLKETLQEQAQKLNIDNKITWHGVTQNLVGELAHIDIIVQPSLWEGLSLVVMEEMAAGKVVIASNEAGEELIHNKKTGFLVASKDVEAIKQQIKYCIDHEDVARDIGKAAQVYAQKHFDLQKNVQQVEEVYREVMMKKV